MHEVEPQDSLSVHKLRGNRVADQLGTTPLRQLNAAPYYLPNLIAAIAASVGVIIGSVGPWASLAWITANGAGSAAQYQAISK